MIRHLSFILLLLLAVRVTCAAPVVTEISGVDGELLANVRAHLTLVRAEGFEDISVWRLRQIAEDGRDEVRQALRPFGFYRPRVEIRLIDPERDDQPWIARVRIDPGTPVTVDRVELKLGGAGERDAVLLEWIANFPLQAGDQLRQAPYREALRELERLAISQGYFDGRFRHRRIQVDPDRSIATIRVEFDTGQRYRFSGFSPGETGFSDRLMNRLTVIEVDEPYRLERVDEQRDVLVRSGLFSRVAIEEQRDREAGEVHLDYQLEPRPPNSYRATLGFGTDTGARLQLGWDRHYFGSRGNRLDSGFGAQQRNNEFVIRSEYQHPRGQLPSDFLTAGILLRRERDSFRFNDESRREAVFEAFGGTREQAQLTAGRLRERELWSERFAPLEERIFLAYLNESFDALREASFSEEQTTLLAANPEIEPFLKTETNTLALGASWRLANIQGSGFGIHGQVLQFQVLGASTSAGSDVSFAQAYLSGRWHWLLSDRHKLLLRGEIGYTEAKTRSFSIELDDRQLDLTITELPERYRFKTGGDRTVRGYGFERLSTNRNGANHVFTGSAEYELRLGNNWSVATFFDVGNAFNDFSDPKLKRGVGAGFRFYTLIGPIQVDVARALDDVGRPWRLHLTIGTQLL